MTSLARAFVAVVPPPAAVAALEARLASVRATTRVAGLRWIPASSWHVTLRFLGRVPDAEDLAARLGAAVAAVPAVAGLRLAGAGAFPEPRHGSVLWVGVAGGEAGLAGVAGAVETACVDAGFAPDPRPFHAHVTVARSGRARDLRPVVDAVGAATGAAIGADPVGDPWTASAVTLMASDTRPDGAVYEEVARLSLAG